MSTNAWLLLAAGTVFTTLAVGVFLFTLWYGLHCKRWLPLLLVTSLWLVAMTVYALLDSSDREGSSRQRIGLHTGDTQNQDNLVEVNLAAG